MAEPSFPLLALARLRMGLDGRGVTTLAAGAGCPLRCRWCINRALLEKPPVPVTARELYERAAVDDLYFRATGGGVTFGGGEALLHAPFIAAFRAVCGGAWRLTVETSLAVPRGAVETALEAVDEFIVDVKDLDPVVYRRYTGGDVSLAEGNLRFLLGAADAERVLVRAPLIPGWNTPGSRAETVRRLRDMGVTRIDAFSYVLRDK